MTKKNGGSISFRYLLMCKDRECAKLDISESSISEIESSERIKFLIPRLEDWAINRVFPSGRPRTQRVLSIANLSKISDFLDITHGVSLIDTFWLKRDTDECTWEQVNPYRNKLNEDISTFILELRHTEREISQLSKLFRAPSPDYTADGSADKVLRRVKGTNYLYKTTGIKENGITGNRPYCEYYASQVAEQLISDKNHITKYSIAFRVTEDNKVQPYVYCPMFTSETNSLLEIADSQYRDLPVTELYERLGSQSQERLREMLLLDSLILNCDRHDRNYGILYNSNTFESDGLSPIFDNDCSLGYNVSLQFKELSEAYSEAYSHYPRTEMGDYLEQARWALTDQLISNMRNMYPFHFKRLPKEVDLEDRRIQFMEGIVNTQIKRILSTVKN